MIFSALINLAVFVDDAFDQALFFHPLQAISDLVLIRHEQRAAASERDADLN
jgi:hypothetical protein